MLHQLHKGINLVHPVPRPLGRRFIEMDPEEIQVKASKAELARRIVAFTSRKRALLDQANCLEFRGEGGAARVAAVLGRSRGSKGHLRRSRVDNSKEATPDYTRQEVAKPEPSPSHGPLDTRLAELEQRVIFREDRPVPGAVYRRLRELEDRVEELEGLSPDHCRPLEVVRLRDREAAAGARREARAAQVAADIRNIDARILALRSTLRAKVKTS